MAGPTSHQLADILLNRHTAEEACALITSRHEERERARRIVAALPPGITQRTPEWYAARKGMLTASEFKIAGADKVSSAYVLGKVFPKPFTTNDAMTWGCRFEDLACATYEIEHDTKVREFGLLLHPDASWIGASPDGITDYGVAVEIKTPYSRKLVEIGKRVEEGRPFAKGDKANLHGRYRAQVQGQLEVCDLEVCDFTVAHIDEMEPDGFWQRRRVSDARHRYALVVDVPKAGSDDGAVAYKTSPLDLDDDALQAWLSGILAAAPSARVWYAHVRELGVERIERDRDYWARLRDGLGRTKDAIDTVMAGAAKPSEGAKPVLGNPSLFAEDDSFDDGGQDQGQQTPASSKTENDGSRARPQNASAAQSMFDDDVE